LPSSDNPFQSTRLFCSLSLFFIELKTPPFTTAITIVVITMMFAKMISALVALAVTATTTNLVDAPAMAAPLVGPQGFGGGSDAFTNILVVEEPQQQQILEDVDVVAMDAFTGVFAGALDAFKAYAVQLWGTGDHDDVFDGLITVEPTVPLVVDQVLAPLDAFWVSAYDANMTMPVGNRVGEAFWMHTIETTANFQSPQSDNKPLLEVLRSFHRSFDNKKIAPAHYKAMRILECFLLYPTYLPIPLVEVPRNSLVTFLSTVDERKYLPMALFFYFFFLSMLSKIDENDDEEAAEKKRAKNGSKFFYKKLGVRFGDSDVKGEQQLADVYDVDEYLEYCLDKSWTAEDEDRCWDEREELTDLWTSGGTVRDLAYDAALQAADLELNGAGWDMDREAILGVYGDWNRRDTHLGDRSTFWRANLLWEALPFMADQEQSVLVWHKIGESWVPVPAEQNVDVLAMVQINTPSVLLLTYEPLPIVVDPMMTLTALLGVPASCIWLSFQSKQRSPTTLLLMDKPFFGSYKSVPAPLPVAVDEPMVAMPLEIEQEELAVAVWDEQEGGPVLRQAPAKVVLRRSARIAGAKKKKKLEGTVLVKVNGVDVRRSARQLKKNKQIQNA
jgi:hypothetical protein